MKIDAVRIWAWHVALVVSLLLFILSLKVGVSFLFSVLRAVLGFVLIYGICETAIIFFEKTGPLIDDEALGAYLDIAVGQDEENAFSLSELDEDEREDSKIEDSKLEKPLAGQVNKDLTQGLPDAEKQAEIIRRMGWGDD